MTTNGKKKQKVPLIDHTPGPLSGKPIVWRAFRIRGHMDRVRIGEPVFVEAESHHRARHLAALRLGGTDGGIDPLHVDAEPYKEPKT